MAFIGLELFDERYNCGPRVVSESGKSFNEICTLGRHQQWQPTALQMLSGNSSNIADLLRAFLVNICRALAMEHQEIASLIRPGIHPSFNQVHF